MNDAFCIYIEVIFQKTGQILIPTDSYRKKSTTSSKIGISDCPKIVKVDVRSPIFVYVNQIVKKAF